VKYRALVFKHYCGMTNVVTHADIAARIWLTTPGLKGVFKEPNHIGGAVKHAPRFWLKVHSHSNASSVFKAR
jgi:hypothetical protein